MGLGSASNLRTEVPIQHALHYGRQIPPSTERPSSQSLHLLALPLQRARVLTLSRNPVLKASRELWPAQCEIILFKKTTLRTTRTTRRCIRQLKNSSRICHHEWLNGQRHQAVLF